jgi:hypothetical protein
MSLAWSNLNRTTPDLNAAEQDAQAALKMVPYWHYVRDILMPQIRAAQAKTLSAALRSSETAFEKFKGFEGKWAIRSGQKTLPIEMTYESASKASIVTEQFGKELSVFYRDGQSLLMTHFCNAGNQPRLRLGENTRPGVFEFQMFDITNLQSADADHVERVVYRIIDDKTIALEIVWKNGKSEESEKYTLTRLDSEQHVGN